MPEVLTDVPKGRFVDVDSSSYLACALPPDGVGLTCWGTSQGDVLEPPLGRFVQVEVGYQHACARNEFDGLICWGMNSFGQTDVPE